MRVFKDVGLVEQLGSGMSRILKAYRKDIFEISEHFIKVVFPFKNAQKMPIIANGNENGSDSGNENGIEKNMIRVLSQKPNATPKELSSILEISTRKVARVIKTLKEEGKISRVASDRKGYWKVNK